MIVGTLIYEPSEGWHLADVVILQILTAVCRNEHVSVVDESLYLAWEWVERANFTERGRREPQT